MLLRSTPAERDFVDASFSQLGNGGRTPETSPLQALLQYKWWVLLFALAVTGAASVVLKQLPVRYSAAASLMVDARKLQVIDAQSVLSSPTLDLDRLRTYMEQLQSPAIAQAVVAQLGLTHVPEYCAAQPGGWLGWLLPRHDAAPATCSMSPELAAEHLLREVSGSNDGRSYIIRITAEAANPVLAAAIANAYAHAYVAAQRQQIDAAAEQADTWLASYIDGLRKQMQSADAAVEQYQRKNQLTPLRGETVVGQQLAELNSQLTLATSALAEKQASLRQVQSMAHDGQLNGSAPVVLASPLVQRLVERQSELQASLADLRAKYGDAYPAVQSAMAQLDKLRQAIQAETGKTLAGLADEVAALGARKAALTANVQALQSTTGDQGAANVRLQELQRDANTEHRLYEAMLTRLHEVDAERHMQWPSASVVVEARPPGAPSFPRVKMMLAGIFMVALGLGAVAAFAITQISRVFRDLEQVEWETGMRVLGLFPRPPRRSSPTRMVPEQPGSLEAETLQFILPNLHLARPHGGAGSGTGRVVMVSSAVPGEGKTCFAIAIGQSAVQAGMSVVLLDCDLRSATASRMLDGAAGAPARQQTSNPSATPSAGAVQTAQEPSATRAHLHVMPIRACIPEGRSVLAAADVAAVLARLRPQYDLVLVDTPPVLALPDALTLAPLVDETVLMVDWARTPRRSVLAAIRVLRRNDISLSGIVLSKIDLRRFARQAMGDGFYARRYSGFGARA